MLLSGATLFDGTGAPFVNDSCVRLENGRIAAVGTRPDFLGSTDEDVLDLSGSWLLPGFIDMHAHVTFGWGPLGPPPYYRSQPAPDLALRAVRTVATMLARGRTTLFEMGGREGVTLALRDAIGRGELPGPRMFVCNQPIAVTGGHSSTVTRADLADGFRAAAGKQLTVNADGADGFRAAARKQLSVGADFVKVMASHEPWDAFDVEPVRAEVSVEEMSAAFNEAREWGKLCAAHATGRKALSRVIEAGVHLVQHGHYLTADIADEMALRGIALTPTLSCYDVQVMSKRISGRTVAEQAWGERQRLLIDGHASGIAAALKAGVSITVGTDVSGIVSEEVRLLRSHGMSAVDSLLACSLNAARAIRMEDELGTVQAGKRADLVVLGSDPLLSPSALDDVRLVVKDGRLYDPRALLVNILPAPD